MTVSRETRAVPGTRPRSKGRGIGFFNGVQSTKAIVHFLCYRPKTWSPNEDHDTLVWEFYLSEEAWRNSAQRVKDEGAYRIKAGKFPLGALLHPKIAQEISAEP